MTMLRGGLLLLVTVGTTAQDVPRPVPDRQQIEHARRRLRETIPSCHLVIATDKRIALIGDLLAKACGADVGDVDQYVILEEALDHALRVPDAVLTLNTVSRLLYEYDLDLDQAGSMLQSVGQRVDGPCELRLLARAQGKLAERALARGDIDLGIEIMGDVERAAREEGDASFLADVAGQLKRLRELAKRRGSIRSSSQTSGSAISIDPALWRVPWQVPAGVKLPSDFVRRKNESPPGRFVLGCNGEKGWLRVSKSRLKYSGEHSLTIEAVVRPARCDRTMAILSDQRGNIGFRLFLTNDGYWAVQCHPVDVGLIKVVDGVRASSGRTVHLAATFDSERREVRLYVNGRRAGRKATAPVLRTSDWNLIIGGEPNAKGIVDRFDGEIEQVRISRGARYVDSFKPVAVLGHDESVMMLLHCNEGAGDTAYDSSGHGAHAAVEGAAWVRRLSGK